MRAKHVQAFPTFGVERRGAPVAAFLRIDSKPIRLRCQVDEPDHVVILDPTLIPVIDVTSGLKPGGWVIVNCEHLPDLPGLNSECRIATVDAAAIAAGQGLGARTNPIVNTAILGAVAKFPGIVDLESVIAAIEGKVPAKAEQNMLAAREAYHAIKEVFSSGEAVVEKKKINFSSISEMPEVAVAEGSMMVNKTGSWRYLRPVYREKTGALQKGLPPGNGYSQGHFTDHQRKVRGSLGACCWNQPDARDYRTRLLSLLRKQLYQDSPLTTRSGVPGSGKVPGRQVSGQDIPLFPRP